MNQFEHPYSLCVWRHPYLSLSICMCFFGSVYMWGFPVARWRTCLQCRRLRFDPWVKKIPWRRSWQPTPVFLPGESHGQKSLAGYSPWSRRVRHDWSTWAQYIYMHIFGEGNGYPLQYSCLENSVDRRAWWATVHGLAELDTTEQLTLFTFHHTILVIIAFGISK